MQKERTVVRGNPQQTGAGAATSDGFMAVTGATAAALRWSAEEDRLIEEGVRRFGCKWRQIATALPGRSDSYATEASNP